MTISANDYYNVSDNQSLTNQSIDFKKKDVINYKSYQMNITNVLYLLKKLLK